VNECTAQLADSTQIVSVGTLWRGSRSQILPSVRGNSPLSAQYSATVAQVHSDTGSLCIENWDSNIFILLQQNHGTAARMGERTETYTNDVWCDSLTVENVNGETCRHF